MPTKLRVSAGPSTRASDLVPIAVNRDSKPLEISSDTFQGRVTVRIKDYTGEEEGALREAESGYFDQHHTLTWSIQIQGRFLQTFNSDDVVFGNTFDKPIRDSLPYGSSLALKAGQLIDPPLQQDVYADKPWAWSPLLSTMNQISITKLPQGSSPSSPSDLPEWTSTQPPEDVTPLYTPEKLESMSEHDRKELEACKGNPTHRRKWFSDEKRRKEVELAPQDVFLADFCNGFINFNTLSLKVPMVGLEWSLTKYWDGQPVRYVCQTRDGSKFFFCVIFEIIDDELLKEKAKEGKKIETSESNQISGKQSEPDNKEGEGEAAGEDKDQLGVD